MRAAAVGSCRSAVPIWTAVAPLPKRVVGGDDATAPTIWASGRPARTSVTQRSASGRIAGPLRPACRRHRGRQRVADDDGRGPGVEHGAGALDHADHVGAQAPSSTGIPRGRSRCGRDDAGGVERLAYVEHPQSWARPARRG